MTDEHIEMSALVKRTIRVGLQARILMVAVATLGFSASVSASLVFDPTVFLSAQGFGNAPRDLTVHATPNTTGVESGCVGISASNTLTFGNAACTPGASVHDFNNVVNVGGDEPSPQADNQKYGGPSFGSLGISSADQIGILFNATEPAGNGANVYDVTLNFWTTAGSLLGAIDGSYNFLNTDAGNGSAGYVFVVSSDELAYVNGLIAPTVRMTINATIGNSGGGPDSFMIANLRTARGCTQNCVAQLPEPGSLALLAAGVLASFGARRSRRR